MKPNKYPLKSATNESDVGVGTIVGSAVFNLLVIVALSAALAGQVLNLDWRPLARDSVFYAMSICVLITFAWDGYIFWYIFFVKIFEQKKIFFGKKRLAKIGKKGLAKIGKKFNKSAKSFQKTIS